MKNNLKTLEDKDLVNKKELLTRFSGILKGVTNYKKDIEQLEELINKYPKETINILSTKHNDLYMKCFFNMPIS